VLGTSHEAWGTCGPLSCRNLLPAQTCVQRWEETGQWYREVEDSSLAASWARRILLALPSAETRGGYLFAGLHGATFHAINLNIHRGAKPPISDTKHVPSNCILPLHPANSPGLISSDQTVRSCGFNVVSCMHVFVLIIRRKQTFVRNAVSWVLRRVALVRTDVSEEFRASIIRVTRIGEIRKELA
jgi:hypothetical protein